MAMKTQIKNIIWYILHLRWIMKIWFRCVMKSEELGEEQMSIEMSGCRINIIWGLLIGLIKYNRLNLNMSVHFYLQKCTPVSKLPPYQSSPLLKSQDKLIFTKLINHFLFVLINLRTLLIRLSNAKMYLYALQNWGILKKNNSQNEFSPYKKHVAYRFHG